PPARTGDRGAAGGDRLGAARPGRIRRALREDPHLQLPPGPGHGPPRQADRERGGEGSGRGPGRVHGRAFSRGEAPPPRGADRGDGLTAQPSAVRDALEAAVDAIAAAGSDSARLDAELLLAEATGWDRAELATDPDRRLPVGASREFALMVRRRVRREPVAYILGRQGFRRLELGGGRRGARPPPRAPRH